MFKKGWEKLEDLKILGIIGRCGVKKGEDSGGTL